MIKAIGPRPPLPDEVDLYSPHDRLRLSGKPGLTGTWQVYGRSQAPFQTMVDMDIAYLREQSFWKDLRLIALMVPVMLKGVEERKDLCSKIEAGKVLFSATRRFLMSYPAPIIAVLPHF